MAKFYKYPPERLAELAAESRSVNEILRKLGLPILGGNHTHISRQLKQFGIDTSHFTHLGKQDHRRSYTRETLRDAAARSRNIAEMLVNLGSPSYPRAARYIEFRCWNLGVDLSHFEERAGRAGRTHQVIDPAALREAVAEAPSIAAVQRALELPRGASGYRLVRRWSAEHGVDLSRLPGQAHNRGKKAPRLRAADILRHEPERAKRQRVHLLRRALTEIGRACRCATCGIETWNGAPIILEVDHVNGDWRDNRPENLRYLCPNCHSQTDTFCGRNRAPAQHIAAAMH
ncbi:HNH endonuclease [Streptodolium elevatio]